MFCSPPPHHHSPRVNSQRAFSLAIIIIIIMRGARVAQWLEQSPPTSVAWVQIPASCLSGLSFSSFGSFAPRGFSLGTPVVSSLLKPTFPNSNSTRNQVDEVPLGGCTISKSLLFSFVHRQSSTTASFICLMKMSLHEALRKGVSAF